MGKGENWRTGSLSEMPDGLYRRLLELMAAAMWHSQETPGLKRWDEIGRPLRKRWEKSAAIMLYFADMEGFSFSALRCCAPDCTAWTSCNCS